MVNTVTSGQHSHYQSTSSQLVKILTFGQHRHYWSTTSLLVNIVTPGHSVWSTLSHYQLTPPSECFKLIQEIFNRRMIFTITLFKNSNNHKLNFYVLVTLIIVYFRIFQSPLDAFNLYCNRKNSNYSPILCNCNHNYHNYSLYLVSNPTRIVI